MSKPFNLQAAIAGAPVMTREGRKVIQFVYLDKATDESTMPVCIVFEDGKATRYPLNGQWIKSSAIAHPRDLVMVPNSVYHNVWCEANKAPWIGGSHQTREEAERAACNAMQEKPRYILLATVERPM